VFNYIIVERYEKIITRISIGTNNSTACVEGERSEPPSAKKKNPPNLFT
jgi:hypothetical protein